MPKKKKQTTNKLIWFKRITAMLIWAMVGAIIIILWLIWDIPNPDQIIKTSSRKANITILDNAGKEILKIGGVHGKPIDVRNLPIHISQAFLAIEDRRFYSHIGIDIIGLLRAAWVNFLSGRVRQGGSTLTQQLAKNLFLTREKTIKRKIQEAFLALWLENRFNKDQLLSIYLNRTYFGSGVYGIDAAAHKFFNKKPRNLSLYQAAVIAGLPKAPSRYNPIASPKKSAIRANIVLDNMVAAKFIKKNKAKSQKQKTVKVTSVLSMGENRRYFTDWIMTRLTGYLGHIDQDIIVNTTLNSYHQKIAEKHINDISKKIKSKNADAIAFLSLKPDGAVTAMLGGYSWNKSNFNRTTQALRQPASAFKPIVFLAGLEAGLKPDSKVDDRKITVNGWSPRNSSGDHRGQMTLREGAARSSNSVAVAVSELAGRDKVLQMARRLGISSRLKENPAIALGVYEVSLIEIATSYAVFANGGHSVNAYGIVKITNDGGDILYKRDKLIGEIMVKQKYINDLNNLLTAVITWGTGKTAKINRPAAGKTGTSQGYRDAWFIGYSKELVAGIWIGNDNASPTKKITGGNYPAKIWKSFMRDALKGISEKKL